MKGGGRESRVCQGEEGEAGALWAYLLCCSRRPTLLPRSRSAASSQAEVLLLLLLLLVLARFP